MSIPVSVVILAKNEEVNIRRCLHALGSFEDVVVIDDNSTDSTAEIAAAVGARVIQHKFVSFAQQRNWAMQHAGLKHLWVLNLDADEVVTPALMREIKSKLTNVSNDVAAFRMCRKTMFMDTWLRYSDGFPIWIMRLAKRGRANFEDSGHGEVAVPQVDGTMSVINEPFLHFAVSKGLSNWIDRHNGYSSREAELELNSHLGFRWGECLVADKATRRSAMRQLSRRLPFRPTLRFFYQYVLKRGFLDGRAGFVFCRLMATYEWFIVLKRRELDLSQNETDAR